MTDLKRFIHDLNQAWQEKRFEDLYQYFHKDVVMLPPGTDKPVIGIEPMVESYCQFAAMGTIHAFNIIDTAVHEFESAAVCHVRFEVDYEIEAGRFQEQGMEIYTVEYSDSKPKIIWRTQHTFKT